jgi:hypothetical protein
MVSVQRPETVRVRARQRCPERQFEHLGPSSDGLPAEAIQARPSDHGHPTTAIRPRRSDHGHPGEATSRSRPKPAKARPKPTAAGRERQRLRPRRRRRTAMAAGTGPGGMRLRTVPPARRIPVAQGPARLVAGGRHGRFSNWPSHANASSCIDQTKGCGALPETPTAIERGREACRRPTGTGCGPRKRGRRPAAERVRAGSSIPHRRWNVHRRKSAAALSTIHGKRLPAAE